MSIYEFLRTIAAQLGDDRPGSPFRRYTLKDLAAYYSEAMCFVAANRPDLMTEFVIVKLQPGTYQDAAKCCGCTNVISIEAQVDADGRIIKDLSTTGGATGKNSNWYRPICKDASTGTTLVISTKLISGMNGWFTVDPPIPVGEDVWVMVKCVKTPTALSEADILAGGSTGACTFLPAVRSYILYRALQGDRHAVGASAEAQNELKNVYTYLGITQKAEKAQEQER